MWTTVNKGNAIEGAAITVRFGEPLNTMVVKRAIRALEDVRGVQGFTETQPLQTFNLDISPSSSGIREKLFGGVLMTHTSLERDSFNQVVKVPQRQLIVQPEQIVLQISRYREWPIEMEGAIAVLTPLLKIVSSVVTIKAVRLEYLNRFIFDGGYNEADITRILKPSPIVAAQAFKAQDLWHSHFGQFDEIKEGTRRLTQVNADVQRIDPPHPSAGYRSLALMLAVEKQYDFPGTEVDAEAPEAFLSECFSGLHDGIHGLFKEVVDSNFAHTNGLPQ
ncbi:hypothetical protein [Agrobacterium vitis]|uniref:hypothetical protein n=1 Tax=Agrobacterium vitis TaxID=373 RepID=UPI0012E83CF4|nr:hypothetical protein [Agrobacterium vitis]MUZ65353.1 hypothetical protein [Agrobacterium vitis]